MVNATVSVIQEKTAIIREQFLELARKF